MEKLNLPPFTIGQKVVCVVPDRIKQKGKIYTVEGVVKCPHCSEWLVNFGVYAGFDGRVSCTYNSNKTAIRSAKFYHAEHTDFAPLQEQKFKAVTFEKLCEEVELICEN